MPNNPRYANGHRRRELRRRVLNEETTCKWAGCEWPGEPVDKNLKTPHPKSPEVDEIIPVSRGGDPLLRSNVQLLHRLCNQRKSNKTQTAPVVTAKIRTSRAW